MTTSQNAEVEYHYVILVSGTLKKIMYQEVHKYIRGIHSCTVHM